MEGRRYMTPEAMAARQQAAEARKRGETTKEQRAASAEVQAEEVPDEQELALENEANETDAVVDEWVEHLINNGMMTEAGKLTVDVQKIYDQGLDEHWLQEVRQKARNTYLAPPVRDKFGNRIRAA